MEVKPLQAESMIQKYIRAGIVPLVTGSPGIGKSHIVHAIAKQYNLKLIDLRLSQCDPSDLLGYPTFMNGRADYAPFAHFPIEGDPLPEGYSGWLLFLDELTSALPAIQAAAYRIILDRQVGSHKLHKRVAIVGAGNLETDGAIVEPMSTALQSRLAHLQLGIDVPQWLDWAASKGIDPRITSYINYKPKSLYTFSPTHTDHTYAAPRTWEFSSNVLKELEPNDPDTLPMLAGLISEGVAREFFGFMKIEASLLRVEQIIKDPNYCKVPDEPSALYAMTGSIAQQLFDEKIEPLMTYVTRMPAEFQVVCLREAAKRNTNLVKAAAFQKWIKHSGASWM